MQTLLANKCIKYVNFDEGSQGQTGEIGFYGGELFDGEIVNNQPKGWGRLQLPDSSYYEGNFDNNGMTDGKFVHFSRDSFEGKFIRDRFHRGTMIFKDGDSLEGEWAMERVKWNLRYGSYNNEEKTSLCLFGKDSKETSFKEKGKEVFKTTEKDGFTVRYDECTLPDKRIIKNLAYTSEGSVYYEDKAASGLTERITTKLTSHMPLTKIDLLKENTVLLTTYKMCHGFNVESKPAEYRSKLTFTDLIDVCGDGVFELDKIKFKFKGKLLYKNTELGSFMIKKTNFSDLEIKFNDVSFESMNSFCTHIGDICAEKFKNVAVYVFTRPQKRKRTEQNAEVIGDIITDIKSHNNCVIM